jgi:putative phosphoribosyl transferase
MDIRAAYRDRTHAGQVLARELEPWRHDAPIVLGIPRGGVVVAAAIAGELGAELDVVVVRKVGAPHQPELAIGAVSADGQTLLDHRLIDHLRIPEEIVTARIERELREAKRRMIAYRGERPPPDLSDRTVVVVDDGIATGATMTVALDLIRKQGPRLLIAAVPVAPPTGIAMLQKAVDEVVCPLVPRELLAVGAYYEDFLPTSDETVVRLLHGEREKEHFV